MTGSLGILLKAKQHGMIASLGDCIARMRQHDIWISADLVDRVSLLPENPEGETLSPSSSQILRISVFA